MRDRHGSERALFSTIGAITLKPGLNDGVIMISNSNWTEWSTIQGVIGRVISNRPIVKCEAALKLRARLLPELREALGRFEITSTITP